ncbi:arsenate reductase family protein [Pedobacter sp.]|uniref:arsenate reductase family protein n=1 Tax=Pedobacter sp. TaxID=1411316 RepID=UPI0031E0A0A2
MSIKIYHNSRCSKSNAALRALESQNKDFTIINYLENPPSVSEIKDILKLLGMAPLELMRTGETVFKEKIKGKNLSDEELVALMHENPILIQRPIIIQDGNAFIARSEEALNFIHK